MARTRPARALLKKMDPAPAPLVARHTTAAARLPPRRPIDAHQPRVRPETAADPDASASSTNLQCIAAADLMIEAMVSQAAVRGGLGR